MGIRDANAQRVLQSGNSFGERMKYNLTSLTIKEFSSSPSYFNVSMNNSSTLTGVQIVDNSANSSEKVDNLRQIIMKPNDTLNTGDLIEWNNDKWLCTSNEMFSDIYWKGTIQKTNNTLKYYKSNISSQLFETPCIIGKGNLSEDTNKFLTLASDEYLVCTTYNVDTAKIDKNTRFILSSSAYNVIGVDNISQNGLLWIRIKEGLITANDNENLGIADYYSNQITREVNILNGTSSSLLYTNQTLQINIECKENGVVITNPTVTYTTSDAYVCTVSNTGLITAQGTGDAVVTVHFGSVSDTIAIHSAMVVQDNYNVVITPADTTVKANRSLTLDAMATNNGINDPIKQIGFEVSNLDGSSNQFITYVVTGNSITISAGDIYNKFINIKAYMLAYPDVFINRQIKIVSLV